MRVSPRRARAAGPQRAVRWWRGRVAQPRAVHPQRAPVLQLRPGGAGGARRGASSRPALPPGGEGARRSRRRRPRRHARRPPLSRRPPVAAGGTAAGGQARLHAGRRPAERREAGELRRGGRVRVGRVRRAVARGRRRPLPAGGDAVRGGGGVQRGAALDRRVRHRLQPAAAR